MERILVTGALGQIGTELVNKLNEHYDKNQIIASDIRNDIYNRLLDKSIFAVADSTNAIQIERLITKYNITTIYHLVAILSASAEERPMLAWEVNMQSLMNILEAARAYNCAVFVPSSIGAFGADTPKVNTPQATIQRPTTIYGITKLTGELLCDYYFQKFDIDTRGLRFPGLISHVTEPGGGTTDYSVDIYIQAVLNKKYNCYVREDTKLDMMYMPDAIDAMIKLMKADPKKLINRNAYNVKSFSVTPKEIAASIKKFIPEFEVKYHVEEIRQKIADSWPQSMDVSCAKSEWGFNPKYDLDATTKCMINAIKNKHIKNF